MPCTPPRWPRRRGWSPTWRRRPATGDPSAQLGADRLARLLSSSEAVEVDLAQLSARADGERDRLRAMLDEACGRIAPGRPAAELVPELLRDHPDAAGVIAEAQALTDEVIAWTTEHRLAPYSDGTCLVGPAPESRQWATAMMAWSAPGEPEAPSWYHVTPPRPEWPEHEREEWLQVFSRTTLPAITVHEVAPGHFSHGLAIRHAPSLPRQVLAQRGVRRGLGALRGGGGGRGGLPRRTTRASPPGWRSRR